MNQAEVNQVWAEAIRVMPMVEERMRIRWFESLPYTKPGSERTWKRKRRQYMEMIVMQLRGVLEGKIVPAQWVEFLEEITGEEWPQPDSSVSQN